MGMVQTLERFPELPSVVELYLKYSWDTDLARLPQLRCIELGRYCFLDEYQYDNEYISHGRLKKIRVLNNDMEVEDFDKFTRERFPELQTIELDKEHTALKDDEDGLAKFYLKRWERDG